MGWDAYSEPFNTVWGFEDNLPNGTKTGDREWDEVVDKLFKEGVRPIDGLLRHGGLDVSICGHMLELATHTSVYEPIYWSPEKVQELARTANWNFPIMDTEIWARESARAFLEHCAKLGRGIRFSW